MNEKKPTTCNQCGLNLQNDMTDAMHPQKFRFDGTMTMGNLITAAAFVVSILTSAIYIKARVDVLEQARTDVQESVKRLTFSVNDLNLNVTRLQTMWEMQRDQRTAKNP